MALATNEIPISEILDRVGEKWLVKYDSIEHFENSERAIKSFIKTNINSSQWNKESAETHLRIQNFETITESVGSGHEITLLIAQRQKLQNTYDVSEPEPTCDADVLIRKNIKLTAEEIVELKELEKQCINC